jgi:hypothetical protein
MSGNVGTLSLNITLSYQPNSHMWLMLAVLPVNMVSDSLPLVLYILLLVNQQINASSFNTVVPKYPGEADLNHFTGHITFQFTDTTLSSLLTRGVGFSLSCVAVSLAKFPLKVSFELLF